MTDKQLIDLAHQEGFADAALVSTQDIVFDPSFRPYCEENLCGQFGVNYTCPPDCGTVEQMRARVLACPRALVLQSIWEISDYSDAPAIRKAKRAHNDAQLRLAKALRGQGHPGFLVGASGCALCSPCNKAKGLPCAFPELRFSCMSAYCIFVRELTERCGMEYDCGEGLLAFFGMYVME